MMQYSTIEGVQGICPIGWHVPSDAEWTTMSSFVSNQPLFLCNNISSYIAKSLASTSGWNSNAGTCAVGNNQSGNNSTGFSGLPAGGYYSGSFLNQGTVANFWSATQYSSGYFWYRGLNYSNGTLNRNIYHYQSYGYSVRCLKY